MKVDREDKARERRIDMEVVVDAYDEAERAIGKQSRPSTIGITG